MSGQRRRPLGYKTWTDARIAVLGFCRHFVAAARPHHGHGAGRFGRRRGRRLRHRRADAAGFGADRGRRAGGAHSFALGAVHEYQSRGGVLASRRSTARADRARRGAADLRARRVGLYPAHRQGRGAGDRRHAGGERAAASLDAAARSRALEPRTSRSVLRLGAARGRHRRRRHHPALASRPMPSSPSASGSPSSRPSGSPAW